MTAEGALKAPPVGSLVIEKFTRAFFARLFAASRTTAVIVDVLLDVPIRLAATVLGVAWAVTFVAVVATNNWSMDLLTAIDPLPGVLVAVALTVDGPLVVDAMTAVAFPAASATTVVVEVPVLKTPRVAVNVMATAWGPKGAMSKCAVKH